MQPMPSPDRWVDVLLEHLVSMFTAKNVMVVFTEDLRTPHAAGAILRGCWRFLGLDPARAPNASEVTQLRFNTRHQGKVSHVHGPFPRPTLCDRGTMPATPGTRAR